MNPEKDPPSLRERAAQLDLNEKDRQTIDRALNVLDQPIDPHRLLFEIGYVYQLEDNVHDVTCHDVLIVEISSLLENRFQEMIMMAKSMESDPTKTELSRTLGKPVQSGLSRLTNPIKALKKFDKNVINEANTML